MRVGRYRFSPPWWGIAVTVLFAALFVVAGNWQIQRGQAKARIVTRHEAASKAPAQPLLPLLTNHDDQDMTALYGKSYQISGHYDSRHQILLDNQPHNGRTGYHVWTPLVMHDGRRVLVERGWIALGPEGRRHVPKPDVPAGQVTVSGLLRDFPRPGVRLGQAPSCVTKHWPRVLNYPTFKTVRCLYSSSVVDGLILLNADAAGGFERDWHVQMGGI